LHPSGLAVQSPIFPGEYSQFWPSFVHAPIGFAGELSVDVPDGGQPRRASVRIDGRTMCFTRRAYTGAGWAWLDSVLGRPES
jgi:hypothetical protein